MDLLQMGISGGCLILFILAVRVLLRHRLPKRALLLLWETAALRLVLPLSIPLPFSIFPKAAPGPAPAAPIQASAPSEAVQLLPMLWALGTLVLAAWFLAAYVRNMRDFRMSLPHACPAVEAWLAAHRGLRPLEVRVSDKITSPLTYGLLRPVILLPKSMDTADPDTLAAVLTHEYIHVRRLDNGAKLLFAGALCLHWWDPLVWAMYVLGDRDMELSCDAGAIRTLGMEHRSAYALALISMEERRSGYAPLQSCFSQHLMTERIEAIMKFKRSSAAAAALAAVLTIGGAAAAFAVEAEPQDVPSLKQEEILGIAAKDGSGDQAMDIRGDIPFAQKLEPDSDCQILPKSQGLTEELPPLEIPQDFRDAVQKGEIPPLEVQEGVTLSVFDEDGRQVSLDLDGSAEASEEDQPYLHLAPQDSEA